MIFESALLVLLTVSAIDQPRRMRGVRTERVALLPQACEEVVLEQYCFHEFGDWPSRTKTLVEVTREQKDARILTAPDWTM